MLHFDSMRRVQIANPEIADVVISSVAQLGLYGKQRGVTVYMYGIGAACMSMK